MIDLDAFEKLADELVTAASFAEGESMGRDGLYKDARETLPKLIAELKAARAVIAAVGRETFASTPGDCTACGQYPGHGEGCAWKAYDEATKP